MNRTVDMTKGSAVRHLLRFAFPLLITNLGQQLYMIADAAIVGRGVGVKALAAVGATDWSYWLILWTVVGLTQGFSTFVSRYFGEKNYKKTNKVIANSVVLTLAISAILTFIGIVVAEGVLKLLNTPEDIFDGAYTYLVTMISGTVAVAAYNLFASFLRAFGDGRSPLVAMGIAAVLNIALDCLFVFLFGLGIFGAALASILSQTVAFIYCFIKLIQVPFLKLDRRCFELDWRMIRELLIFGIPLALEYVVIALGGIFLQGAVNEFGSVFIAGYTATNKVYGLLECSAISLGLASATFLGQNYGAGLKDRFRQGVKTACIIVCLMAIAVMVFTLLVRKYLLLLFLDVSAEGGLQALDTAVRYLTIMTWWLLVLYLIHVFRNALQAMKISLWSFVSGCTECAARIFMAKFAVDLIGPDALFISEPLAWMGALITVVIPYFWYRRKLLK